MGSEGFLLVDKPGGWTSHDVVARTRNLAAMRKVGHAGTLDPMATGLLVLGLGRATRLLRFVQGLPKEYLARAQLGVATDTLDAEGVETARHSLPVDAATVEAALAPFRGEIEQTPPMVSAIKVGGQKLYEMARRGEEVDRPSRRVEIHELEMTGFEEGDYPFLDFRVVCSSGTYVRTLADDIGRALGGRAHLVGLHRTRIGSLRADDAHTIDALAEAGTGFDSLVMPPSEGLTDLARVTVDEELARRVSHGSVLSLSDLAIDGPTAVLDDAGNLLAVYGTRGRDVRAEVVMS